MGCATGEKTSLEEWTRKLGNNDNVQQSASNITYHQNVRQRELIGSMDTAYMKEQWSLSRYTGTAEGD